MKKSNFQTSKEQTKAKTNTICLYPDPAGCLAVAQNLQIFARHSLIDSLMVFSLTHILQKDSDRLGYTQPQRVCGFTMLEKVPSSQRCCYLCSKNRHMTQGIKMRKISLLEMEYSVKSSLPLPWATYTKI